MKFKVGDRVRVVFRNEHHGHTGPVVEITLLGSVRIECSCGGITQWGCESSLELIENTKVENKPKNIMKKLNNLFKKLTDPSVQSLSEAGILNGDLELTEEGSKELLTILFLANKDALVARAEEIIKEAKEK